MSRKADIVEARLRRLLDSGRYPLGSRLPAERALAQELGVSRALLRTTLERLEAEGRLWRHVGQGTFVGGRPIRGRAELALVGGLTSPAEVMEVRLVIEPHAARLAAIRATGDDILHLRHCFDKSVGAPNYANYARWDATLHRAIAEAARNALLLSLFDAVSTVRQQPAWSRLWQRALTEERKAIYRRQHKSIVDAVAARDAATATEAMRAHLLTVERFLLAETRRPPAMNSRRLTNASLRA